MSAILRRGRRASDNFTMISNDAIRDSNLSLKARALLCLLMSHQDGWEINVNSLARVGKCGRDAVMTGLKELREAGYLRMSRSRDASGRLGDWVYEVSDIPGSDHPTDSPKSDRPKSYSPESCDPTTKEDHLPKKIISKEEHLSATSAENRPTRAKAAATRLPDDWEPTPRHHEKATHLNVDIDAAAERMRRWAYAKDARRKNWNSVFNTFLADGPRRGGSSAKPNSTSRRDAALAVTADLLGGSTTFNPLKELE